MRVRKGKKGLYYTDGKLDHCDYNYYNCSLWQAYQIAYNQFLPEFLPTIKLAVENVAKLLILGATMPFWGKILKNCWKARCESSYSKEALTQDFPKDYYEVLTPSEGETGQGCNPCEVDSSVVDDTLFDGDEY